MKLDQTIVELALEKMHFDDFERFAQIFLSQLLGVDFSPTGGYKDGGQDGYIFESGNKVSKYVQISKEKDPEKKVRKTILRLIDTDRKPQELIYVTSVDWPQRDAFEMSVLSEQKIALRIFDLRSIVTAISLNEDLSDIFESIASTAINSLIKLRDKKRVVANEIDNLSVLTYINIHTKTQPKEKDLLLISVDAAIYQALEGTNPDKKKFKSHSAVIKFVESKCPSAVERGDIDISRRIARLSSKKNSPRIGKHNLKDADESFYCLPWDIRNELDLENQRVISIMREFDNSIQHRALEIDCDLTPQEVTMVTDAVKFSINSTFREQTLNASRFISGTSVEEIDEVQTFKYIQEALQNSSDENAVLKFTDTVKLIIRHIFYSANKSENEFLVNLFKLHAIEFALSGNTNVTKYFKSVVSNLRLIIGTDILVRIISEICLNESSKATTKMLKIIQGAGSRTFVTDSIVQELYHHIRTTINEFETFYRSWESSATIDETQHAEKILIRSYFYAKLEPDRHQKSPSSFKEYIAQFGSIDWFLGDRKEGIEFFKAFVVDKFDLEVLAQAEILTYADEKKVQELINRLEKSGKNEVLAANDAELASYVNKYRDSHSEMSASNPLGYSTWWLTEDVKVVRTAISMGMRGKFAMDPQYIALFFLALPDFEELRNNHPDFPTCFALRITERLPHAQLRQLLTEISVNENMDPTVRKLKMAKAVNELKSGSLG